MYVKIIFLDCTIKYQISLINIKNLISNIKKIEITKKMC